MPDTQNNVLQMPHKGTRSDGAVAEAEIIQQAHKFWDTQPVPKLDQVLSEEDFGPLAETRTVDDVRKEPYPLPDGFTWSSCDITDPAQLHEVYQLLEANYVEDDDNMFRFRYSEPFILWALSPPGFDPTWHISVRIKSSSKLVGFITGVPATVQVKGRPLRIAEINFLCVHKKLRSKRLAPVLIKEITRRINLDDRWQACYTAGAILPTPIAKCRYWHRSLNPKKLCEVGFSCLTKRMTLSRAQRLYKVPDTPRLSGIRPMKECDVDAVTLLIETFLKPYSLFPVMGPEEVAHWILPRQDVIYSFVREVEGKITDVISFYMVPSSVIGNEKHQLVTAAYSYYNVATSTTLRELIEDALILAKQRNCDVFNALDLMDNQSFLKELKFGVGDGFLRYYVYNWKCKELESDEVALVLL
eukprot:GHVQ01024341.1.p1 GENE.GHVQ01024341.1~~GHVQ01024341.1.p1  ORF type:complete len:415 (+),score=33.99 GHVQ01024341.1:376-1620(+)